MNTSHSEHNEYHTFYSRANNEYLALKRAHSARIYLDIKQTAPTETQVHAKWHGKVSTVMSNDLSVFFSAVTSGMQKQTQHQCLVSMRAAVTETDASPMSKRMFTTQTCKHKKKKELNNVFHEYVCEHPRKRCSLAFC